MGYTIDPGFSGGGGSTRATPPSRAPLPSSLSQPPSSSSSSFGRIDLTSAAVTGIQMAATAPGYIYERPLAALNTIGKSKPTDKGFIDQAGDTIRNIPVLGDLLSGGAQAVGNTIEGSGRIFPALANSWVATALNDNYGRGDNEKVSGVAATLINFNPDMTVGELRQYAAQRGFTPEDALNIHTGKSGIFDFSDKAMSTNPLLDLSGRLVVDPLNLVAMGGAVGAITKGAVKGASMGGLLFDGTTMMSRVDKLATGAKAIEDAVKGSRALTKGQPLFRGTLEGMAAIQRGEVAGVTLGTLSRHLATLSRGSSDALRVYRRAAVGTWAVQLGIQELGKSGITDNTPLSPIMDQLYEAANMMAEDKPLSTGMLYNLWAVVNFPAVKEIRDAIGDTKTYGLGIGVGKATIRTPLFKRVNDVEEKMVEALAPGMPFKEGRQMLIDEMGGEQRYRDVLLGYIPTSFVASRGVYPALMNQPTTTAGFTAMAEGNNRALRLATIAQMEKGQITGKDLVEHIQNVHTGARSTQKDKKSGAVEETVGRVYREWDPRLFMREMREWADTMERKSLDLGEKSGGNVIVGVVDGLMPKEHLVLAKEVLKDMADADGTIPKHRIKAFLEAFPGLRADINDPGNFFERINTPEYGDVSVGAAVQRIDRLLKDSRTISIREYTYGLEQLEKRAESIKQKRGTVFDENGNPNPDYAEDYGNAGIIAETFNTKLNKSLGLDGGTLDDVLASRGSKAARAAEDDLALVLQDSGWNVRNAVQSITSVGGKLRSALAVTIDSKTDVGAMEVAAVAALKRTKSKSSLIWYSGQDALTAHGLQQNAIHFRYDISRMSKSEKEAVLSAATESFDGSYRLNDTADVLHVWMRPGQEEVIQNLTDSLDNLLGRDRVSVTDAPAWVQTVWNDMKGKNRGSVPDGTVSARSILDATRSDIRLVNADRRFSERLVRLTEFESSATSKGAVERRGTLGEERPGFTGRPDPESPGGGVPGDDGRGVSPYVAEHDAATPGDVVYLAEMDDRLEAMTPTLKGDVKGSPSALGGLPAEEIAKLAPLEVELRQYSPQHRLKATPVRGNVASYHVGMGNTLADLAGAKEIVGELWYHKALKPAAQLWGAMFDPVKTSVLARDAKQAFYREMLNRTAHLPDKETVRIRDLDSFLQTADAVAKLNTVGRAQIYTRGELLSPHLLRKIADGSYARSLTNGKSDGMFPGFTPAQLEAIGGAENIHKILDRAGSRFYRNIRDTALQGGGKGELGRLLDATYGPVRSKTSYARSYIRTFYHIFRFTLDPRFHAMNHFEADAIGILRDGVRSSRLAGANKPEAALDAALLRHSKATGKLSDVLGDGKDGLKGDRAADAVASGYLDARRLEGYIARSFERRRLDSARDVIIDMANSDPVMRSALNRFGGTVDDWVNGLDESMYKMDTKGVREAFLDEALVSIPDEMDRRALEPLMVRLYDQNSRILNDVKGMYHGNTNRSNAERTLNSYFLYWPISYQLKAAKWLFGVLTEESFGRKTNLGGAWYIDQLYDRHVERLAEDEGYQRIFVDNPDAWFMASMMLPMTPWDMGVGFSRTSRYILGGAGIVVDRKDFTRTIAGDLFTEDPGQAAVRIFQMGPAYSIELAKSILRQANDDPKPLVVPVN